MGIIAENGYFNYIDPWAAAALLHIPVCILSIWKQREITQGRH